jgi:hypothetical protein
LVPQEELGLNFVLEQDAKIKVDLFSLAARRVNSRFVGGAGGSASLIDEQSVPQYYIDKSCFKLTPQEQLLTFNWVEPNNYKSLDPFKLYFDSDLITIRPFPDVGISYEYNSYVLIGSEATQAVNVRGGGVFGVCLPSLPVYAPLPPPIDPDTSPN